MKNMLVSLRGLFCSSIFFSGFSPNNLNQKRFKVVGRLKWWHLLRAEFPHCALMMTMGMHQIGAQVLSRVAGAHWLSWVPL